jgi:hypothetical protein
MLLGLKRTFDVESGRLPESVSLIDGQVPQ